MQIHAKHLTIKKQENR